MNQNEGVAASLPMLANKVNPTPRPDAVSVTGLVKQGGRISGYQLSNGQKVDRQTGVNMAKNNQIKGVGVAENKGTEYLRALPDGNEANNLGNLPTVGIE